MKVKKRLMFNLNDDFNFITLKLLIILHVFDAYNKSWTDVRKIGIMIEFQKDNIDLFKRTIRGYDLSTTDKAKLLEIYTKGKIHETTIRKVIKTLDNRDVINVSRNNKYNSLDIQFLRSNDILEVIKDVRFDSAVSDFQEMKEIYNRVKSVKYSTFIEKTIRGKEVLK